MMTFPFRYLTFVAIPHETLSRYVQLELADLKGGRYESSRKRE